MEEKEKTKKKWTPKKKKTRTTNKCTKISKDGDVNKNEKIKNKQSIKHLNKKSKQKPNKHYSGVLGDYNIEETLLEQIFFFFYDAWVAVETNPDTFFLALPGYG